MDHASIFAQLRRSFDKYAADCARVVAHHAACELDIATAEYELDQVRKLVAGPNRLARS